MKKIGLISSGTYLPEDKLTNADFEKLVETTDEWIVSRTGIRERRIASYHVHPSDMAALAAENCLSKTDKQPHLLISSSGTNERIFPYQSSIVANKLNLKDIAAFDINAACSGLVYGISVASSLLRTSEWTNALITASEKMTSFVDYQDRASCILFGDGASAVMISSEDYEHEIVATELGLDASGSDLVTMGNRHGKPHFWQDGKKVFRFAVTKVGELIEKLKTKANLNSSDKFYIVPHQANRRILEAVADKKNIPMDRFIINIDRFGNTSSASIGIALDEAWNNKRFQKNDTIFLIAFGGGLSWAGAAIKW